MNNRICTTTFILAACAAVAAVLPSRAEKLPTGSMSAKGLLVSFDYSDGREQNRGYGKTYRDNQTAIYTNEAAFYDGIYGRGPRGNEDCVIPQLNFDHFTVACSFNPVHTNSWGQYFFRIGMDCWSVLEVSLGNYHDVCVSGRKLSQMSAPYVKDEWNWLVLSVDAEKKQALLTVNGCDPVVRTLPDDFYWFIPSDRVDGDKFRRITFGNWQCGKRYWGYVDDLMVYDRALDRDEIENICRRKSVESEKAGPSCSGVKSPVVPTLRDNQWFFQPGAEQSVYWNGSIAKKGLSLKVHRERDGICVERVGGVQTDELDLTLPVVDGEGRPTAIVGIGSECDPYCIEADKTVLARVKLPSTLKYIHRNAFAGSRRLTKVDLPSGLLTIGQYSFSRCDGLEEMTIPESVGRIEDGAFQRCTELSKVSILGKRVWIGTGVFVGAATGGEIPVRSWTTAPIVSEVKPTGEKAPVPDGWVKGPNSRWFVRWDDAAAAARKSGKKIFALKTGSDWCGWCVRLHDNVLGKKEFLDYADKNLVLLYLDSPRKEGQPEAQKKHNAEVAKSLKMGGGVPNASVVDASGRSLGTIGGGGLTVDKYVEKLEEILKGSGETNAALERQKAEENTQAQLAAWAEEIRRKKLAEKAKDLPEQTSSSQTQVHSRTLRRAKASEVKKALDELTAGNACVKGLFRVAADDRVNKLIIVTDKSNLDFVDAIIAQLDIAGGSNP